MGALAVVLESFWTDRMAALKRLAESVERESGSPGDSSGRLEGTGASHRKGFGT
jgi:hypothetical protein